MVTFVIFRLKFVFLDKITTFFTKAAMQKKSQLQILLKFYMLLYNGRDTYLNKKIYMSPYYFFMYWGLKRVFLEKLLFFIQNIILN